MKKQKNETKLFKAALKIGMAFAIKRGYTLPDIPLSDSQKAEIIYRLLVEQKCWFRYQETRKTGQI